MINVFIDTNIYLNFFRYSEEDLEELNKLLSAEKTKQIKLYLTDQVKDEFKRQRESTITETLQNIKPISDNYPVLFKEFDSEYEDLKRLLKDYNIGFNLLKDKMIIASQEKSLKADKIVGQLFNLAICLEIDKALYQGAKKRFDLGNPPGKGKSYGDAVNWEAILNKFPEEEDLYFVSGDKDFQSSLDNSKLSQFLSDEWKERKKSTINFYSSIILFFKANFPHIKLAEEFEKEAAVNHFVHSSSFVETHSAILEMSKFSDFSKEQILQMLESSIENGQIWAIAKDKDVSNFVISMMINYTELVDNELRKKINQIYILQDDP